MSPGVGVELETVEALLPKRRTSECAGIDSGARKSTCDRVVLFRNSGRVIR